VGVSLKPSHLKRYSDLIRLFVKHGRGDLVRSSGLNGDFVPQDEEVGVGLAEDLTRDLERLGPTGGRSP